MIPDPIGRFDYESGEWEPRLPYVAENEDGLWLAVRVGGPRSDGASVPTRVLQALVGPRYGSKSFAQAFNHDMGYAAEIAKREQIDLWFYYHLRQRNNRVISSIYYGAVAAFGGTAWKRHTRESVAHARKYIRLFETEADAWRFASMDDAEAAIWLAEQEQMEGGALWLV